MRELIARVRAQRGLQASAGLPSIGAALEANADLLIAAEDAVHAMTGAEPCIIAAKLLLILDDMSDDRHAKVHSGDPSIAAPVSVLRSLRPVLTGFLARRVDDVLSAPENARFGDVVTMRKKAWPE